MTKRRITFALSILVVVALVFILPWVYSWSQAKPLYGLFDVGNECMGGHEIFLELEADQAFENCPGHRFRKPVGPVERTSNSVVIDRGKNIKMRVEWNGTNYTLEFSFPPGAKPSLEEPLTIYQVHNLWRLWLPRWLPEK
jgi:hypothetical protein